MATYQVETDNGTYEIETEDPISKPESFGRAAANNFPLAPQAIAGLSEGDYSKNMADWNAKAASAKEANPITYGAGAVTGAMLPLAIPGVGEAMAANPVAGNALLGAASAVSNRDVLQQPEEAAKDVVKGGLIGGVTAGLLGKLGPTAEGLTARAEKNAVQATSLNPKAYGDLSGKAENMGTWLNKNGLVQGSLEERLAKTTALKDELAQQIEASGAGKAPLGDPTAFTEKLHAKAQQMSQMYDPEFKSQANVYINGIKEIQQNGKTFADLQRIKTAYGDRAFGTDGSVVNQAAKDVWAAASDAMKKIAGDNPQYQEAMTGYSHALDASTGLQKQLGIERTAGGREGVGGHGLHSLLKQVPGIQHPSTGLPMGAGVAAIGHPVLGAVVGLHSLTSSPQARNLAFNTAAKAVGPIGTAIKAGTTEGLVSRLHSNPQSFGKYAPALQKAYQDGGNQGVAATHYILSTTRPEYNQLSLEGE